MTNITEKLEEVVRRKVVRDPYPEPTPLIDDMVYRQEIKDLQKGNIPRPNPKSAYLERLDYLNEKIESIKLQNADNKAADKAAKKAVDDKYQSDLESAKDNEEYKGEALCSCIDEQLNETYWWVLPDSSLNESQLAEATAWRIELMNISFEYDDIDEAITAYSNLLETKPEYKLTWK